MFSHNSSSPYHVNIFLFNIQCTSFINDIHKILVSIIQYNSHKYNVIKQQAMLFYSYRFLSLKNKIITIYSINAKHPFL